MRASCPSDGVATAEPPSALGLFLGFLRLGATAFGGPATVVQMRDLVVSHRRWLSAEDFAEGLALAQVLPGATAMQCAAHSGLRLRGFVGALAAFVGFGLPASLLMLAAAAAYQSVVPLLVTQAVLQGLRLAVVAVVAWAGVDLARAQLRSRSDLLLALAAAALLLLGCHPALVVVAAAAAGMLRTRPAALAPSVLVPVEHPRTLRPLGVLLVLAALALGALFALPPTLARLTLTMMRVDAVAFGGGFAALPLLWDELVKTRAALPAEAFLDGIALGQVTPGPIVVTATFVGYALAGLGGALAATVGIFLPSFVFMVAVAPWWRRLQSLARVRSATRAAALVFVGLLLSMTVQLVRSMPWTLGRGALALAALLALGLGASVPRVVLGCGLLAPLLQKLGVL